jgi:hypothetical protein
MVLADGQGAEGEEAAFLQRFDAGALPPDLYCERCALAVERGEAALLSSADDALLASARD